MGIGSAIAGAGAVAGAVIGGREAKRAAGHQAAAALEAAKIQREMYQQSRADLAPFREFGTSALSRYSDIVLGGELEKFRESPGYQFRLGEGIKALERGAAARGGLLGGRQAKALTRFGQDIASQEYQNYLNQLSYPIGIGQAAAAQQASLGPQYSSQIGRNIVGAGEARASGIVGQTNAYLGGLKQLTGIFNPKDDPKGGMGSGGFGTGYGSTLFGASGGAPVRLGYM